MLNNFFKIAWRNLLRNRGYSTTNIGGLAIGLTVTLFIGLWVYYELSLDTYHQNYDRIALVMQHETFNGVRETDESIPRPLEFVLRNAFGSDFQYLSMASFNAEHGLSFGGKTISKTGNFFQKDFPEMISLEMKTGVRNSLDDAVSVIISESTAQALFGDTDPMNQPIQIDNKMDVKSIQIDDNQPFVPTLVNRLQE